MKQEHYHSPSTITQPLNRGFCIVPAADLEQYHKYATLYAILYAIYADLILRTKITPCRNMM